MLIMMFVMVLTELYNLYKSINKLITPNIQQPLIQPPTFSSNHTYNRPVSCVNVPSANVPHSYPNVQ